MSGETEADVSSWTVDSIRSYFIDLIREYDKRYEQRFLAQETAVQAALLAQEKAVNSALIAADRAVAKAETAAEKRFESVNEFRAQLSDQARNFLTIQEANIRFQGLTEKVDLLTASRDTGTGLKSGARETRVEARETISQWVAIIGVIAAIVGAGVAVIILTR